MHSGWAQLTSSEPATSVRSCAVCSCFRRPRKSMWACMAAKPSAATSMAGLALGCTPALEQMRSACFASFAAVLSRALAAPRKARTACTCVRHGTYVLRFDSDYPNVTEAGTCERAAGSKVLVPGCVRCASIVTSAQGTLLQAHYLSSQLGRQALQRGIRHTEAYTTPRTWPSS